MHDDKHLVNVTSCELCSEAMDLVSTSNKKKVTCFIQLVKRFCDIFVNNVLTFLSVPNVYTKSVREDTHVVSQCMFCLFKPIPLSGTYMYDNTETNSHATNLSTVKSRTVSCCM